MPVTDGYVYDEDRYLYFVTADGCMNDQDQH
jgi:hypothetical protein